jgi:hypothetical protein
MSESLELFLQWANEHNAQVTSGLKFRRNEQGISCFTSKQISGELLRVPEEITITPLLASQVFDITLKGNRTSLTQLLLTKLRFDPQKTICDGTDLKNFFKPYLDILPTAAEIGSPLFYGVERQMIEGTDLSLTVDREIKKHLDDWYSVVQRVYAKLRPPTYDEEIKFYEVLKQGKPGHFASYLNNPTSWTSFPAYLWSCAIFRSRAFPFILNKDKAQDLNEAVLLPIFDLLNHDDQKAKVNWDFEDGQYIFRTQEPLEKDVEVFNSYGPKTNEELLLSYGFALEDNPNDKSTLSLRIPEDQVANAIKFGVHLKNNEVAFDITKSNPLPESLVTLFCFLLKNASETVVTLRNKLEGLKYLTSVLQQKLDVLKPVKVQGSIDARIIKNAKIYRNTQKQLFQLCFQECVKLEKVLLKEYKPLSFKTIYKNDKGFASALLLIFGITSYEQLSKTDDLDRVLILWIIRCGNKKYYKEKNLFPDMVAQMYQSVAQNITVTKKDIQNNIPVYKALFPSIAEKVPEVFGKGDWGIKNFVIAEEVRDKMCFERKASGEVFFLQDIKA